MFVILNSFLDIYKLTSASKDLRMRLF